MDNGIFLRDIGEKMYTDGRHRIYYAPASAVIYIVLKMIIAELVAVYYFATGVLITINIGFLLLQLFFILGVISLIEYLFGLIIIGIGQIAINTATDSVGKNSVATTIFPNSAGAVTEKQSIRTNRSYVSPMLGSIIHCAINMDNDTKIRHYLQESMNWLTKDAEKNIVQHLLNTPSENFHSTLLKVYEDITEPVPEETAQ